MPTERALAPEELELRTVMLRFVVGIVVGSVCIISATAQDQVPRHKILGIARVAISANGDTSPINPIRFYSMLRLGDLGTSCAGAPCVAMYGLNGRQELIVTRAPRPRWLQPSPTDNNITSVTFETSEIHELHDRLAAEGVAVGRIEDDNAWPHTKDADATAITGRAFSFTLKDPDGHNIGFIQYDLPLKPHALSGAISARLIHAGFIVRNQAAMEHFYKDILGFRPYWHGGMREGETDWMDMQVPDGTDWVEFMLNVPEDADQRLRGVMNHIALGVPDIHAAREQLLKNGMQVSEEPKVGRDGKWQLNLYDPDQTRVELMEFTPVQKACCSEYTGPHPKP